MDSCKKLTWQTSNQIQNRAYPEDQIAFQFVIIDLNRLQWWRFKPWSVVGFILFSLIGHIRIRSCCYTHGCINECLRDWASLYPIHHSISNISYDISTVDLIIYSRRFISVFFWILFRKFFSPALCYIWEIGKPYELDNYNLVHEGYRILVRCFFRTQEVFTVNWEMG